MLPKKITSPRKLYGLPQQDWPEGAQLMFQCSSIIPSLSSFDTYLREYGWEIEKDSRLFTQINQSELLKEFLEVILSPLQQHQETITSISQVQPEPSQTTKKTKVFVSYSHQDRKFLADDSLVLTRESGDIKVG